MIFRIVQHALQEGWLAPGQTCLDPFGGVGLGALPCLLHGVQYIGVELEQTFVTLGNANLALWARRYGHLPQYKAPVLMQGDSRQLAQVLGQADVCVASPPWGDHDGRKGGSDLYVNNQIRKGGDPLHQHMQAYTSTTPYGTAPGQLGNLPPGSLDACLSSPPYEPHVIRRRDIGKPGFLQGATQGKHAFDAYGTTEGQLGQMAPGQVEAVVASPPWLGGTDTDPNGEKLLISATRAQRPNCTRSLTNTSAKTYGNSSGQLANDAHQTFWSAARTILEQVYAVLKPGGTAIWIVKAYCRDGAIVDFPGQWRAVCEHVGFITLHEHHALLVEEHGVQGDLFGKDTTHRTERKSFFRRLHEKKRPDLAIDHETILCMQKPLAAAPMPPDEAWQQPALLDACVASPPYAASISCDRNGIDWSKTHHGSFLRKHGHNPHSSHATGLLTYGTHPANLGNMPPGSVDACVASPPWEASLQANNKGAADIPRLHRLHERLHADGHGHGGRNGPSMGQLYGTTPGQLGAMPAGTPPEAPAC